MEIQLIPLYNRKSEVVAYARVDADDAEALAAYTWRYSGAGAGYAMRYEGNRAILMHRYLMGTIGRANEVDHFNGDSLDNRRVNLRLATHAQNHQNRPSVKNVTSIYRGVYFDPRTGKWSAQAKLNGHKHWIGRFTDEAEAGKAASDWRAANMPFTNEARMSLVEQGRAL